MTKIKALRKLLSLNIAAAKVRRVTSLFAVQCNETGWSSIYAMLKRFRDLESYLTQIADDDLQSLLPT